MCDFKRETNKPLETHEQIVGYSWTTFSIVATSFSGVVIVMSGYIVSPIFHITLMIFVNFLQRDVCGVLESRTTGRN